MIAMKKNYPLVLQKYVFAPYLLLHARDFSRQKTKQMSDREP